MSDEDLIVEEILSTDAGATDSYCGPDCSCSACLGGWLISSGASRIVRYLFRLIPRPRVVVRGAGLNDDGLNNLVGLFRLLAECQAAVKARTAT